MAPNHSTQSHRNGIAVASAPWIRKAEVPTTGSSDFPVDLFLGELLGLVTVLTPCLPFTSFLQFLEHSEAEMIYVQTLMPPQSLVPRCFSLVPNFFTFALIAPSVSTSAYPPYLINAAPPAHICTPFYQQNSP